MSRTLPAILSILIVLAGVTRAEAQNFRLEELTVFADEASPSIRSAADPLPEVDPSDVVLARTRVENLTALPTSASFVIYLSTDPVLDSQDPAFGSVFFNSIPANAMSPYKIAAFAAGSVTPGDYFLIPGASTGFGQPVVAIGPAQRLRIRFPNEADLTIPTSTLTESILPAGGSSVLTLDVRNAGLTDVTGALVEVYLSADASFSTAEDTLIGSVTTDAPGPGVDTTVAVPFTIPAGTASADLTIFAVVDRADAIAEADETNNLGLGMTLTVGTPTISGSTIAGTWAPLDIMTATPILTGANLDGDRATVSLPFAIDFFGETRTTFTVHTDGFLTRDTSVSSFPSNVFGDGAPNGVVALFWDDLEGVDSTSGIYMETLGTAPNRTAVIEWHGLQRFFGNGQPELTGQIRIEEGTGAFELHYDTGQDWTDPGLDVIVGVESLDGTEVLAFAQGVSTRPSTFFRATTMAPPTPSRPGVDLTATALTASTGLFQVGDTISVDVTVANSRDDASGPFSVRIVLSEDSSIEEGDRTLMTIPFAALAGQSSASSGPQSVVLPATLGSRRYRVGAFIDSAAEVTETDETNNKRSGPELDVFAEDVAITVTTPALGMTTIFGEMDTVVHFDGAIAPADDESVDVALPFSFQFFGVSKSSVRIHTNGYLSFGAGVHPNPDPLPDVGLPNDIIAPIWEDFELEPNNNGAIASRVEGAAPNRVFVVEFNGLDLFLRSNGPMVTAQVRIFEADGAIEFHYPAGQSWSGVNATIGIEGPSGLRGAGPGANQSSPPTTNFRFTQSFTPGTPTPDLVFASAPTDLTAANGATIDLPVTVRNAGTAPAGATQLQVFLGPGTGSLDGVSLTLLETVAIPALAVGESTNGVTASITLPTAANDRDRRLVFHCDPTDQVAESREENNEALTAIKIGAGSRVEFVVVDAVLSRSTLRPNSPAALTVTARNDGDLPISPFIFAFVEDILVATLESGPGLSLANVIGGAESSVSMFTGSLDPGSTAILTVPVAVPLGTSAGSYELVVAFDPNNLLDEADEQNNILRIPLIVEELPRPNLAVQSLITSVQDVQPGDSLDLTAIIASTGNFEAPASRFGVYLSDDGEVTALDTLLATRMIAALPTGQSATESLTVTIPTGLAPGLYRVGVIADDLGEVFESLVFDNTRSEALGVGLPNLAVTITSPPATEGTVGDAISLGCQVANLTQAQAGAFRVGLYLSEDAVIDGSDFLLDSVLVSGLAGMDVTSQLQLVGTIPASLAAGAKTLGVLADDLGELEETDRADNLEIRGYQLNLPDLGVTLTMVTPTTLSPGADLSFQWSVDEVGGLTSPQSFRVGFFLSTDAQLDLGDTRLDEVDIAGLAAGTGTGATAGTVTLPPGLVAGSYTFGLIADDLEIFLETDRSNNVATAPLSLVYPELAVTISNVSSTILAAGGPVTVSFAVTNGAAAAAPEFRVGLYLSEDSVVTTGDTLFGERIVAALAPGATTSGLSITTSLPLGLSRGMKSLGVISDDTGAFNELDELDNVATEAIEIQSPELVADMVSAAPNPSGAGLDVTLAFQVSNSSGLSSADYRVGFYLADTAPVTTADTLLGTATLPALAGGASSGPQTLIVTLPPGLLRGPRSVALIVDDDGGYDELDEADNTALTTLDIVTPELAPTMVSVMPSVSSGGLVVVLEFAIENAGSVDAADVEIGVLLSDDPALSLVDDTLLTTQSIGPIGAGASRGPETVSVTLPSALVRGTRTIGLVVDPLGLFDELDRSDNALGTLLEIQSAELAVESFQVAPTVLTGGASLMVALRVANRSTISSGPGRAELVFSVDATIDGSDTALADLPVAGLPGLSVLDVPAPALTLALTTPSGLGYIGVRLDADQLIDELDELDNLAIAPVFITPPIDLAVLDFVLPSGTIRAGERLAATARFGNLGLAPTPGTSARLQISADPSFDSSDPVLGDTSIPSLGAGSAGPVTTLDARVPFGLPAGAYFVGLTVDPDDQLAESDEGNNGPAVLTIMVEAPPVGADLVAGAVSLGVTELELGEELTLDREVINIGATGTGAFRVGYYLSDDPVLETSDQLLDSELISGLVPGERASGPRTVVLPLTAGTGPKFVGVIVDDLAVQAEASEANNASEALSVLARPSTDLNLQGAVVSLSASQVPAGSSLSVEAVVSNSGLIDAGSFVVSVVLSTDGVIDLGDLELGRKTVMTLPAGQTTGVVTLTAAVPATQNTGVYAIGIVVDADDALSERDETDNAISAGAFGVSGPAVIELAAAGLQLSASSAPPGADFDWTAAVRNPGLDPAGPFRVGLYLSNDAVVTTGDLLIASADIAFLDADATDGPTTRTARLPPGLMPGTKTLALIVDDQSAIVEFDEQNNTGVGLPFLVEAPPAGVELAIESFMTSASQVTGGDMLTLTRALRNFGDTAAGPFEVDVVLSTDAVLDASDPVIETVLVAGLGATERESATSFMVTVPLATPGGTYTIGLRVDARDTLVEADETNNSAGIALMVTQAFAPGDVNMDGVINVQDVQGTINQALGTAPATALGDSNGDGSVNVQDVQLTINLALGL